MVLHTQGETIGTKTRIWRINKFGYYEEIVFTGNIRNKPKGWRIVRD
jgi:hypothetical protein